MVLVPNNAVRSVSIGIFVNAGTEYETKREAGISHFIEHMVFKGTATRSAFDIANETDSIGAVLN
ncbi:MAG: insulinase family protein, partial [Clostridia bacterium]|nr:insulinase family protein [Clostridia bacterium]